MPSESTITSTIMVHYRDFTSRKAETALEPKRSRLLVTAVPSRRRQLFTASTALSYCSVSPDSYVVIQPYILLVCDFLSRGTRQVAYGDGQFRMRYRNGQCCSTVDCRDDHDCPKSIYVFTPETEAPVAARQHTRCLWPTSA